MRKASGIANRAESDDFVPRTVAAGLLPGAPTESTLRTWELTGKAPPRYLIGGRVMYRRADVLAWVESRRVPGSGPGEAFVVTDRRISGERREVARFSSAREAEAALAALVGAGDSSVELELPAASAVGAAVEVN